MANLTLSVGPVSTTKTVDTTKALVVIDGYIAAYDGPTGGTNQQKVDWLLIDLMRHIREVEFGHRRQTAIEDAAATEEAVLVNWE